MRRDFTDQMGRRLTVNWPPSRIVSLVPSQTELLFDLGIGERVVGVTDFCTEPADALRELARIGGTKRFLFDLIDALEPDLLIGNREENYPEGIERLAERHPVWMSDILRLEDALAMIRAVAELVGAGDAGPDLAGRIEDVFAALDADGPAMRAAYLIWKKPWMVAAGGTFIDDMLRRAGFANVFGDRQRYPETGIEELRERAPDVVMLSSEPFPFGEGHVAELAEQLPDAHVIRVDAMPFSWYGSRLIDAPRYFRALRAKLAAN